MPATCTELVSVVLPTFNRAETLARAIRTVLAQTHANLELIIVDDGSTDSTPSVVNDFAPDPRVRYHRQPNQGAGAARNQGIELARGLWIAFQDSDDEWLPEKLSAQLDAARALGGEIGVLYSDMIRITTDGREDICVAPEVSAGALIDPATLDYQVFGIGIQTALIRRDKLLAVGGLDPSLPRFIDLDLFARLALTEQFARVPTVLVRYYQTQGITSNPSALASARERLLKKHATYFDAHPFHLAHQYLRIAEAYWKVPDAGETARYCRLAMITSPGHWYLITKALAMQSVSSRIARKLPSFVRRPLQ